MDNNIIDLEQYRQQKFFEDDDYVLSELMCVQCYHRWYELHIYDVVLAEIQCPNCHAIGTIIDTGQYIPDKDELMLAADKIEEEFDKNQKEEDSPVR